MNKPTQPLHLQRETLRALETAVLPAGIAGAGAETGSNPHSACVTCTLTCPCEND
jgi:hypothetical protein